MTIAYSRRNPPPSNPLNCTEPNKTKGSFKDECDINKIVAKYKRTGYLAPVLNPPRYLDVSEVQDYQAALEVTRRAEMAFRALDAKIRAECLNDPAVFVQKLAEDPSWGIKNGLSVATITTPGQPAPALTGEQPVPPKADK